MHNNFYTNFNTKQKIIFWAILQSFIIIILISIYSIFSQPKEHVEITNKNETLANMPEETRTNFDETLWTTISEYSQDFDKSSLKDAVVRDGTYEEYIEDGTTTISFLMDIDSIKQTFVVSMSWSKNKKDQKPNELYIGCPKKSEMKYPETFCQTTYNNTYSLDLYLPYISYPENDESNDYAPNVMISGDEENKILDIMVSTCDPDKYKKEAFEYLKTTPIDLNQYQINYEINSIDVSC